MRRKSALLNDSEQSDRDSANFRDPKQEMINEGSEVFLDNSRESSIVSGIGIEFSTTSPISQFLERRERGLFAVRLSDRFGVMAEASSRSSAVIEERGKCWDRITERINRRYPMLMPLNSEQCKKLCAYYRRRLPTAEEMVTIEQLERDDANDEQNELDNRHESEQFAGISPSYMRSNKGDKSVNVIKRRRGRHLVELGNAYGQMCDNHSRLQTVNNERRRTWQQITDMTNTKFPELPPLKVEQAKKLYAHYRTDTNKPGQQRALFAKKTAMKYAKFPKPLPAICQPSVSIAHPQSEMTNDRAVSAIHLLGQHHSSSSSLSFSTVAEFLSIIRSKDAEIDRLRSELVQNSVRHRSKLVEALEKMTELVKTFLSDDENAALTISRRIFEEIG